MFYDPNVIRKFQKCGISVLDAPGEVVGTVLIYLGKDANSEKPEDLTAAEKVLMSIRPYVRKIESSAYIENLASGEWCLVLGWSGDVLQAASRAEDNKQPFHIKYHVPKEGAVQFFDNFAIPADAAHVKNAHLFIDFMNCARGGRQEQHLHQLCQRQLGLKAADRRGRAGQPRGLPAAGTRRQARAGPAREPRVHQGTDARLAALQDGQVTVHFTPARRLERRAFFQALRGSCAWRKSATRRTRSNRGAIRTPSPISRSTNITKRFGDFTAVNNVSLKIYQGEIFCLLGGSGCGKSTLLRMLAGFETPTSGSILLDGQDMADIPPYQRPVNMMFQSYALFPHMTVEKNVAFGLEQERLPKGEIAARVEEILGIVKLGEFAKRKPHQLSGGQRQRVALARALVKRPKLLLLDEPLGALDKKLREHTQFELINIQEQLGVTFIVVTHDQEEAMTLASRIGVMNRGEIVQIGTPTEIYEFPSTRFVADFIGSVNMFEGQLIEDLPDRVRIQSDELGGVVFVDHGISAAPGADGVGGGPSGEDQHHAPGAGEDRTRTACAAWSRKSPTWATCPCTW